MRRGWIATTGASVLVAGGVAWLALEVQEAPARVDGKPIRVEVLNGTRVHRAGWGLAEELRDKGFDVVDIRNADRDDYAETIVLDRVGVPEYAARVADAIGVPGRFEQRNGDLLLEVTVILGRDRGDDYRGGR